MEFFLSSAYEISGNAYLENFKRELKEKIAEIKFKSIFEKTSDGFISLLMGKLDKTGKRQHLNEVLEAIKEKFDLKTRDDIELEMIQSFPDLFNDQWENERGIVIYRADEGKQYYYNYEKKKLVSMAGQYGWS